jgi:hypothetical protein
MWSYFASFIILADYILCILDFAKNDFDHWIDPGVFRSRAHSQSDIIFAKNLICLNFIFRAFCRNVRNFICRAEKVIIFVRRNSNRY